MGIIRLFLSFVLVFISINSFASTLIDYSNQEVTHVIFEEMGYYEVEDKGDIEVRSYPKLLATTDVHQIVIQGEEKMLLRFYEIYEKALFSLDTKLIKKFFQIDEFLIVLNGPLEIIKTKNNRYRLVLPLSSSLSDEELLESYKFQLVNLWDRVIDKTVRVPLVEEDNERVIASPDLKINKGPVLRGRGVPSQRAVVVQEESKSQALEDNLDAAQLFSFDCSDYPKRKNLKTSGSLEHTYIPGQLIVKLKDTVQFREHFGRVNLSALKATIEKPSLDSKGVPKSRLTKQLENHLCGVEETPILNLIDENSGEENKYYLLKLPGDADVDEVVRRLKRENGIQAEVDALSRFHSHPMPYPGYVVRWDQGEDGMNAAQAWQNYGPVCWSGEICKFGTETKLIEDPVVVAVIDVPVRPHYALNSVMWKDPDALSLSTPALEEDLMASYLNDYVLVNHSTFIAGIIAAVPYEGNHSVAGIAWNVPVQIMSVPLPINPDISDSEILGAINTVLARKAAGVNIRVVNMSFGGDRKSNAQADTIRALGNAGVLVVASAGNTSGRVEFPAAHGLANIISVANSGMNKKLMPSSARDACLVDLAAPGELIQTTTINSSGGSDYGALPDGGTSLAAPHVTAMAAQLFAHYPEGSFQRVKWSIIKGSEETPLGDLGGALLNGIANLNSSFQVYDESLNSYFYDYELPQLGAPACKGGDISGKGKGSSMDLMMFILLLSLLFVARKKEGHS